MNIKCWLSFLLLRFLNTIPSQEITPFVSFSIIKKLFELESNFGFRNDGISWNASMENGKHETFARAAIIGRLIDTIITSSRTSLLLDTLDILRNEKNQNIYLDSTELVNYSGRLCDIILVRVSTRKLPLNMMCRAVCSFGEMERDKKFNIDKKVLDKMCVGILDKSSEVTINNIVDVFRTIQYFTKSQRLGT
jgi:hypothetical protein